jgi:LysM repeat protein
MKHKLSVLGLIFILSALILSGFGAAPAHARSMDAYIVRPGDTLIGIAARHGLSVSQLARANGLRWNSWVYLARRFGASSEAIMRANGLTTTRIYVGQQLIIPTSGMVYTVKWGDTLSRLARRFGTTVETIMAANNLRSARILVGQRLVMPGQDNGHPTLAVMPTSGPSGTMVEITADGFPCYMSISLGRGPQNSEFVGEVARGTTDANGRFTVQVPVQGGAGMSWVFGANAGDAHAISVPFHITH